MTGYVVFGIFVAVMLIVVFLIAKSAVGRDRAARRAKEEAAGGGTEPEERA